MSLDLRDEVLDGEAEHVDAGAAGVEPGAGVGDQLDELGDRRDVELLDLALHQLRGERGEAGQGAEQGRQVHAGVADGGDLDLLVAALPDRVEAEEGEEDVGVDAFHPGAVGHDQAGIDPLERAFGNHDRDLLDRLRLGLHGQGLLE